MPDGEYYATVLRSLLIIHFFPPFNTRAVTLSDGTCGSVRVALCDCFQVCEWKSIRENGAKMAKIFCYLSQMCFFLPKLTFFSFKKNNIEAQIMINSNRDELKNGCHVWKWLLEIQRNTGIIKSAPLQICSTFSWYAVNFQLHRGFEEGGEVPHGIIVVVIDHDIRVRSRGELKLKTGSGRLHEILALTSETLSG